MHNLFSVLTFAGFILFTIGLFNPNISLFWYKEERTKKKSAIIYGFTIIVSFFLIGFFSPEKESVRNSSVSSKEQNVLEEFNCKIVKTEIMNPIKKTIYVQIPEQLVDSQLKKIALKLKQENKNYEKLFIFYLLPNMKIGSGIAAWATTHFNPDLEIHIIGIDKKAEEKLKKIEIPNGEIIGKWYDNSPYMENSIIIFKKDGKYKMIKNFKDGSKNEKLLQFSKIDGKSKFEYKNKFGEYLLVENDGNLGQYDENGLIATAERIE